MTKVSLAYEQYIGAHINNKKYRTNAHAQKQQHQPTLTKEMTHLWKGYDTRPLRGTVDISPPLYQIYISWTNFSSGLWQQTQNHPPQETQKSPEIKKAKNYVCLPLPTLFTVFKSTIQGLHTELQSLQFGENSHIFWCRAWNCNQYSHNYLHLNFFPLQLKSMEKLQISNLCSLLLFWSERVSSCCFGATFLEHQVSNSSLIGLFSLYIFFYMNIGT